MKPRIVCVHEDRTKCLIGVKLTVLSLLDHCPDISIIISCPNPPRSFQKWVRGLSHVEVVSYPDLLGRGWDVKPTILLRLLEDGHPEVIWIDSDIVVSRDFRKRFSSLDEETLVVTQEPRWAEQHLGNYRTIAWGLEPARTLTALVNTAIIRVTNRHLALLRSWQTMLQHPVYIRAQSLPGGQCPRHMLSDQEALTALLGAREFANVPVDMLQRGLDIAQCFRAAGYSAFERLRSLRNGCPTFIHAMDLPKPWSKAASPSSIWHSSKSFIGRLRDYYVYVSLELSPYTPVARKYREQLAEDTAWMDTNSAPARILEAVFARHPVWQGAPLSFVETGYRCLSRLIKKNPPDAESEFRLERSPLDS